MAQKFGAKVSLLYAIQLPQNLYALERSYPITIDTDRMAADGCDELRRFWGDGDVEVAAELGTRPWRSPLTPRSTTSTSS